MCIRDRWEEGEPMQETAAERSCPVCGAALEPIQVLEKAVGGPAPVTVQRYAAGHTQPRRFMGMDWTARAVAPEGFLRAWVCTACARVQLYAVPDTEPG